MRRDLVEAELFIVIGADPFGRVDGAFFERRINIASRDLLGNGAELLQHAAGESADAHLDAFKIIDRRDFLAEPTAHLTAGIAGEQRDDIVIFVEFVEHFSATAQRIPALVQTLVGSESDRGAEREGWVLAEIIIGPGVAAFDGAILHRIENL